MSEERSFLTDFYVTTLTSVYHVRANDPDYPTAEKIALRGKSELKVGNKLSDGSMIAICDQLISYIPEGGGYLYSFERHIENVNTRYWRGQTSQIVALFTNAAEAVDCLALSDLRPADPRWLDQTREVLKLIGEDHPQFYVCHYKGRSLLPAA